MTTVAVKDSKQQIVQAFQQILTERKKLESKIATKQVVRRMNYQNS